MSAKQKDTFGKKAWKDVRLWQRDFCNILEIRKIQRLLHWLLLNGKASFAAIKYYKMHNPSVASLNNNIKVKNNFL